MGCSVLVHAVDRLHVPYGGVYEYGTDRAQALGTHRVRIWSRDCITGSYAKCG